MIETVAETGSTNADLLNRLASGERVAEGDWLVAERQNAGRGRQGREWFDGHGNFMGSTVVTLGPNDPPAYTLALVAGLAVYEALVPLLPDPSALMLKWPNDVLLQHAKLCGMLLERQDATVVVGIGVNLAAAPSVEGRDTIALGQVTPAPAPSDFGKALALSFATEVERWRTFGLETVIRRWSAAGTPKGTRLKVHEPDGRLVEGDYSGLDALGNLELRLDDGSIRAIHAGDVTLV